MRLGLGIFVYLNLMKQLACLFLLLTIIAIPSLIFYAKNDAYSVYTVNEAGNNTLVQPGNEIFSLGNLGYASTQCVHAPLNLGSMAIGCQYGTIGKILEVGVNPVN